MDYLKAQFIRIQEQLSGLTPSQKMLAGALVVIMVMTLMWWARYAAVPEMEPVLDQALKDDDISRITTQIRTKGIECRVVGGKVMVPVERKMEVLADLGYSQLLPRDTESGFDAIVKQLSPFASDTTNRAYFNRAKEMTMARVIRGFPGVATAEVMIDPASERRIGASVQPRASINMTMNGGAPGSKRLAEAAASFVCGAQSGMQRSRISVIINGQNFVVRDAADADGGLSGGDTIEITRQYEAYYRDKILEQLSFIRGVMAQVTVEVDNASKQTQERKYDPKGVAKGETAIEQENTDTTSAGGGGGEPGAMTNIGASVAEAAPVTGGSSTHEKTRTLMDVRFSELTQTTHAAAGKATPVSASVRVPRGYFVGAYKQSTSTTTEPTEVQLKEYITAQLLTIRNDVMKCTNIKADADVSVETYTDTMPLMAAASAEVASGGGMGSLGGIVGSHAKEIAVGGLALVSLFMMALMVRKAQPAVVAGISPELQTVAILRAGEPVAGEAGEGESLLDGLEVDDDAIRAKQMIEQVQDMVKENPDAAANLVKRWLNRP